MSKLLMIERETTMTYNDKEPLATVQTCNTQLIKRLKQIAVDFPEECALIEATKDSVTVTMPKEWLKISTPRRLSDAQREAAANRMKKNREYRKIGKK